MNNPNEFLCPICQKYPENNCSKCNKIKQALENQRKEFEQFFAELKGFNKFFQQFDTFVDYQKFLDDWENKLKNGEENGN